MDATVDGIASGLRVIEIGNSVAVAVAGVTFADAGADVLLVEPPGGSPLRQEPAFAMWARGKRSTVIDLARADERERLTALLADADVCIIGLKPASVDRFGLSPEQLRAIAPQLVVATLSGFGTDGPFRDVPIHDGVMQARGGRMLDFAPLAGGARPAFAAVPVTAHAASAALLLGIFAALRERERNGGLGQHIETTLAQALAVYDLSSWAPGTPVRPSGDSPFLPYAPARTADGVWVQFAQNGPALFADYIRVLGLDAEFDSTTLFTTADAELKRAARQRILERVASATWAEWQSVFAAERNLSVERFHAPGEALAHPQFRAIGDVVEIDDPVRGVVTQLGPLVDVATHPLRARGPAPALGAAPEPIRARATSERHVDATRPATGGSSAGGLLAGVTVIELGMWIALPFAASQLADLGARVIKLEPFGGDPMRGASRVALKMVQGKESVVLDLKGPEAQEIVHRLVARADVLMHSYRPGVPERLGIDFETLRRINPRIVHLYNGSYGSRGPKSHAPAFHVTGGAVAGGAYAQAGAGCPPPNDHVLDADDTVAVGRRLALANEANPDFNSAVVAAAAVAMGLFARERTGEAVALETRMMLSCAWAMSEHFTDHPGRATPSLPDADLLGRSARYRLYRAADGWVFLAVPSSRDLERLCDLLGLAPLLRDDRFRTPEGRARHDTELADALATALAEHRADDLETRLTSHGVACVRADHGPYGAWLFEQPWARAQGMVAHVTDSMIGPYDRYGPVVRSTHPHAPGGAHTAGHDTAALLRELGYTDEEISRLADARVIALGDPEPPA